MIVVASGHAMANANVHAPREARRPGADVVDIGFNFICIRVHSIMIHPHLGAGGLGARCDERKGHEM